MISGWVFTNKMGGAGSAEVLRKLSTWWVGLGM